MSLSINEVNDLINKIHNGDLISKETLVNENIPLVWSIVHRYKNTYYDKEDLFQIGCLGLLKAIDKFDTSFNVAFSTYAVPLILGEIKRHFRDSSLLRVSRSKKELYLKINKAIDELESLLLRSPTLDEIANHINETREDIIEALDSNNKVFSLDEEISDDNDNTLINNVSDKGISIFDQVSIKLALEKLEKKERLIIELRYFDGLSQQEVSERLNYSQVQISRLETKILEKLKTLI